MPCNACGHIAIRHSRVNVCGQPTLSNLNQRQIHAAGGPTPGTISKWLYKETMFPRYNTISAFLNALGCHMVIVDKSVSIPPEVRTKVARPNSRHKPNMPIRASARRAAGITPRKGKR